MDQVDTKKARHAVEMQFFWLGLEIALIFGIPALAAFFLGRFFDARLDSGRMITLLLLVSTFILSWVIVIKRYTTLSRKLKSIKDSALPPRTEDNQEL